jgi:hypothetical protein
MERNSKGNEKKKTPGQVKIVEWREEVHERNMELL